MSDVVIIAAPERGSALAAGELEGAAVFADSDAPAALQAIVERPPRVVALDRTFADTPRGASLIHRIKSDPALTACEIRIVSLAPPAAGDAPAPATAAAIERRDARATPRFPIRQGTPVSLDGNQVLLVDLSVCGAQVVARTALRPHQRVRVALREAERAIRVSGLIKWATLEMQTDGPRFRAGVAFTDPDSDALARFIDAHRT